MNLPSDYPGQEGFFRFTSDENEATDMTRLPRHSFQAGDWEHLLGGSRHHLENVIEQYWKKNNKRNKVNELQ